MPGGHIKPERSDAQLEFLWPDAIRAHGRLQRFWNQDAAVGLLEILHDRDPGVSHRQPTSIQSVDKLSFVLAFGAIANIRPAGLEGFEIRA